MNQEATLLSARRPDAGRVLLENISWETYEALLEDLGPHPGKRLYYDQGLLEIMTTSPEHERIKRLVGRFIEVLTLELNIDLQSFGCATWKRKILNRGFESDECYYIENEPVVRGRDEIDIEKDPPPDLIVEVEISRSSLTRQGIYAALGVPEIWRFDGEKVLFYKHQGGGAYVETTTSAALPFFDAAQLNRFLAMRHSMGETRLMQVFRDWVRGSFLTKG